jgi:hypothetical protein
MDILGFKSRLTTAFELMRKEGLMARQSFMCCRNCAGYDLATRVKLMSQMKKESLKGCAFYTKQDKVPREDSREFRFFDGLYVSYGPLGVSGEKDYGLPTKECGDLVKSCLEKAGLEVEWDGDPSTRIFVRFSREAA